MKRLILFMVPFFLLNLNVSAQETAMEIVKKADDKLNGETSSYVEMTMKIIRPEWSREMKMKTWNKGEDYFMVYILSPARDKGTVSMKRVKELWNWMPSIERSVKISPSMMNQSWMGSDFTNDDLLKSVSIVSDYDHKILLEENVNGEDCWKIELIPHEDAAIVWSKIYLWVSKNGYNQMKVEHYDEDDFLVNTLNCYDIKMMGGREIPSRMEMVPEDEEGHKTVMIYNKAQYNIKINDSFFSMQNMKRIR